MTTPGSVCWPGCWSGPPPGRSVTPLGAALAGHGVPQAILTDNGKVFTARFGPGPGPVLFDRLCHDNGIRHLLTAPYSPTTDTGVIGRPSLASADKGRAILESLTRSSRIALPCLATCP
jgi:creatinine amidohydrolase/Fe(II)-dependent formamide hydrolase-like protein